MKQKKKKGGNGRGRKWLPATADDEAAMAAAQIAISQVRLITQKGLHPPTFPEKKIRTSFFTMKKRWCSTKKVSCVRFRELNCKN